MNQTPSISPSGPAARERPTAQSPRLRLARLARHAALGVPGVTGTDSGPGGIFVTVSGDERLEGVTCVATKGGGYEVSLQLICALVPLPALADRVRGAVASMAARAGLPVSSVSVRVVAVTEPGAV
jgi:uncharacterized alkaline shock family protein YloU